LRVEIVGKCPELLTLVLKALVQDFISASFGDRPVEYIAF
jgi:hypothetical protein